MILLRYIGASYWKRVGIAALALFLLLQTQPTGAQMTGTSYRINRDTIGSGGLDTATGSNYTLYDTLGNNAIGVLTGTNYTLRAGYRQVDTDTPLFSFSVSPTTCTLGTIGLTEVDACLITLTTTSNATQGYVTTLYNDSSGLTDGVNDIDAVSDGSITAGSEEYGIATEDSDADVSQFTGGSITSGNCTTNLSGPLTSFSSLSSTAQSIIESSTYASAEAIDVCVAAAISVTTTAAAYTDTVTVVSTGYY